MTRTHESENERAVSPVIGVILMVAITVILAAVIATFVLDLGTGVQEDAQAGVTVDGEDVTVTSMGNADAVWISDTDGNCQAATSSVGTTFEGANDGTNSSVVATLGASGDECSALSEADVNTTVRNLD